MAQKNSRERRRSHIDHLENMISILRKENGNAGTCELMETILQLRAENERLRRIINNAKTSLSLASCEPPTITGIGKSLTENTTDAPKATRDINSRGTNDSAQESPGKDLEPSFTGEQVPNFSLLDLMPGSSNNPAQNMALNRQDFYGYRGTHRNGDSQASLQFTDSWMDKMAVGNDIKRSPNLNPFTFLGPLATAMPSIGRTRTGFTYGSTWERSNRIYGQIFDVSPSAACQALALSSAHYADMIFKAVIKGWSALNSEERNNPIMRTLGDMDQVFSELDPVSRAAFMYKSHMLLKYHLDTDKYSLDEIPEWQRPLLSQRTKQHPIAIDFFVWPALRDRLMEGNHNYFATKDFSEYFRRYYKFNWPFSLEDSYIYDRDANTYRLSPIFERYHRNITYWGMQKPFLERFPELVNDIMGNSEASQRPRSPGVARNEGVSVEAAAAMDRVFSGVFTEGELTELFNDYPHVA